ncbi:MAG: cytochrome c oxidase subunit II [Bacteroidia bacterium]|nr:cytochrome c oxidase subunit II [Bacteroidia bacterium]
MNFLLILAVVFGILVLVRIANVAQMAAELSGESEEDEQDKSNKWNGIGFMMFMILGLALMVYCTIQWMPLTLPVAASEHGVEVDKLMDINWMVLIVVFFITQFLLFWFAYKYRYNRNRRSFYFHDNNKLEAIWTIVPTIVLAGLIVTGLVEWNKITDRAASDKGIKIQIYAKQFDFTARYSNWDNKLGASFFRNITDENPLGVDKNDPASKDDKIAKELVLPVGEEIELMINSRDVIHSVYLPHFRVQMNAVPGMTTRFHFKPTITTAKMKEITGNANFEYILLCNKICGVAHYNMKMPVRVLEKDEYKAWLVKEKKVFEKAPAAPAAPAAADSTSKPVAAAN